jgi:hypothetical protein
MAHYEYKVSGNRVLGTHLGRRTMNNSMTEKLLINRNWSQGCFDIWLERDRRGTRSDMLWSVILRQVRFQDRETDGSDADKWWGWETGGTKSESYEMAGFGRGCVWNSECFQECSHNQLKSNTHTSACFCKHDIFKSVYIYMFIYIYICVCVNIYIYVNEHVEISSQR